MGLVEIKTICQIVGRGTRVRQRIEVSEDHVLDFKQTVYCAATCVQPFGLS